MCSLHVLTFCSCLMITSPQLRTLVSDTSLEMVQRQKKRSRTFAWPTHENLRLSMALLGHGKGYGMALNQCRDRGR